MRIRQGRKNPHNLYMQRGEQPADDDPCLGFILDPDVARLMVEAINLEPGGVVRLRRSFSIDADWQRAEELRVDRLGPTDEDVTLPDDSERPVSTLD